MEKVTDFLEKHVQWVVLGLAVLFLGYMAYAYVLQTPVATELQPGQKLEPGGIAKAIAEGPVQKLNNDLQKPPPAMPVKQYVDGFVASMGFATPGTEQAFGPLVASNFVGGGSVVLPEGQGVENVVGDKIAKLPVPPPIPYVQVSQGRAVAKYPDPNWKKPRNNPNVQQAMLEQDVDWVTAGATIPAEQIQAAFEKAYGTADVPPLVWETKMLRVDLQREEQLPSGKWSKQVNVPPLKIHRVQPFPAPAANEAERLNYLDWVSRNEKLVAAPPFYDVAKGQPWYAPGAPAPALVRPAGAAPAPTATDFDPANPPKRRLTPQEKRAVADYKRAIQQMEQNGGLEGEFDRGGVNVGPSYLLLQLAEDEVLMPETGRPAGEYGNDPNDLGVPSEEGFYEPPPVETGPAMGGVAGAFNVTNLSGDVTIWAHDETATPGKTYRYRLRYHLLNPLHKTLNIAADKKVEDQLALSSGWSRWSEPVVVSEGVRFWLAGNPSMKEAKFKVFVWEDGTWNGRDEKAGPGDLIPGTAWMVVDVRMSRGRYSVLVADATGRTGRRDPRADEIDPARIELEEQAAGAAVSAR